MEEKIYALATLQTNIEFYKKLCREHEGNTENNQKKLKALVQESIQKKQEFELFLNENKAIEEDSNSATFTLTVTPPPVESPSSAGSSSSLFSPTNASAQQTLPDSPNSKTTSAESTQKVQKPNQFLKPPSST